MLGDTWQRNRKPGRSQQILPVQRPVMVHDDRVQRSGGLEEQHLNLLVVNQFDRVSILTSIVVMIVLASGLRHLCSSNRESAVMKSLRAGLARMDMLERALEGIWGDQGPI